MTSWVADFDDRVVKWTLGHGDLELLVTPKNDNTQHENRWVTVKDTGYEMWIQYTMLIFSYVSAYNFTTTHHRLGLSLYSFCSVFSLPPVGYSFLGCSYHVSTIKRLKITHFFMLRRSLSLEKLPHFRQSHPDDLIIHQLRSHSLGYISQSSFH